MNINPLTGLVSGASSQSQRTNNGIRSAIESLVSGKKSGGDVSGLSIAAQLQSQVSVFKSAASNVAQAASLTQVADQAIARQQDILDRVQQLAVQAANPALTNDERAGADIEAQGLLQEFNRIARNTQFNNNFLLDGSFSLNLGSAVGAGEEDGETLNVGDLSTEALFEGEKLSLRTQQGAQDAQALLESARASLGTARTEVGSFSQSLDYALAGIQSALFNQDAARSTLEDTDFVEASTQLALLNVQRNAQLAVAAQSNKLPPHILDLLNNN